MKIIDNVLKENSIIQNVDEAKLFGEFIQSKLKVLYYDMGDRIKGEETFVIINTTGEPLTATENLKPILIGKLNNIDPFFENETSLQYYSRKWEEREEWFWLNKKKTKTRQIMRLMIFLFGIGKLDNFKKGHGKAINLIH
ncbi:MAG: hypothetical protein IPN14_12365 [Bacteroidetes bacterium]|nr:hypothetical protein [Bacteroidota bacterium]